MIRNAIDYTDFETGKFKLEKSVFSISECLNDLNAICEPQATEKQLKLCIAIDEAVADKVYTDRTRLISVLVVLV